MSAYESYLIRYPDGDARPAHCLEFYRTGFIDGEMLQFQAVKSLEQQIQGHVLEVLKLREELANAESDFDTLAQHNIELQQELATMRQQIISGFYENEIPQFRQGVPKHELEDAVTAEEVTSYVKRMKELSEELATIRPAAEALKTAVELGIDIEHWERYEYVRTTYPDEPVFGPDMREDYNGDPLAATIKAINRAAEAVNKREQNGN